MRTDPPNVLAGAQLVWPSANVGNLNWRKLLLQNFFLRLLYTSTIVTCRLRANTLVKHVHNSLVYSVRYWVKKKLLGPDHWSQMSVDLLCQQMWSLRGVRG